MMMLNLRFDQSVSRFRCLRKAWQLPGPRSTDGIRCDFQGKELSSSSSPAAEDEQG